MKRIIMLIFVGCFLLSSYTTINPATTPLTLGSPCVDCSDYENMRIPEFAMGDWYEKYGILDGTYYESLVEFGDGTRGKLFMGGSSKQYFVENSGGTNYYYLNLEASIRALYIYKKCGKHSIKYRR